MRNFPEQYDLKHGDVLYFPHIPKTAGMTFRTILEDYFDSDDICPATLHSQVAHFSQNELESYRLFRGHLSYVDIPGLLSKKNLVNVTVLREPISRVISHYDYIRRMPGDPHYIKVKDMTLEEFAETLPVGRVGKSVQAYYLAKLIQFDLNHLPPEEVLALAKTSLDRLAFVGLLECFQDSLFLLSYIFGWKPILNTRKENAAESSKAKTKQQISPTTLEIIKNNTALDLELYQYGKEIFVARFNQMKQNLLVHYAIPSELQNESIDSLPLEVLKKLLERHYEQRYRDRHIPSSNLVSYDFRQALRGTGWHRREILNANSGYRWIGPNPAATLDLPISSETDIMIEIQSVCTFATAPDIPDSLMLTVNNYSVKLIKLYSDSVAGVSLFQGIIPCSVLSSSDAFAHLHFQVDRVVSLTEANPVSPDSRLVGIAINCVKVFPLHVEKKESMSLDLFHLQSWEDTAKFVEHHLAAGEKIIAPLAFKLRLPGEIQGYEQVLTNPTEAQWMIVHKGMIDMIASIIPAPVFGRLSPVFANEVFVVFTKSNPLTKLSSLSLHVRSLYWGRLKASVLLYIERKLRQMKASLKTYCGFHR